MKRFWKLILVSLTLATSFNLVAGWANNILAYEPGLLPYSKSIISVGTAAGLPLMVGTEAGSPRNVIKATPAEITAMSATPITMNKDGVTAETARANLTFLGDINVSNSRFEYGLTGAYGTDTANQIYTTDGIKTAALAINLTPGSTYNYRFRATNTDMTTLGANLTFVLTMPTVTTQAATGSLADSGQVINGIITDMGVATNTYVGVQYGSTPSLGSESALQTMVGIGSFSVTLTSYDSTQPLYYRVFAKNGSVYSVGNTEQINSGRTGSFFLMRNVLTAVIAFIVILVFLANGISVATLIATIIGIIAIAVINGMLG